MNKLSDESLKNVTGGIAGIVDTGTNQNAVVRCGAGKSFEQIDSLPVVSLPHVLFICELA